ncbi:MAG: hypothetical protein KIT62_06075 [Cyclobacteriaceae bacterium]|nr:hypothetical protein [Cyclobacteriaceae bacterium]
MKRLALYAFFLAASVQAQELRFKHIYKNNGVKITAIQNFLHDSKGYIWMGAPGGDLIRFDGTNMQHYGYLAFENDQFSNTRGVLAFEDSKNQLWTATDMGALFKYDRYHDKFSLVNDSITSPHARIHCYAEAPDGSFWLGSMGGGLVRFHPETKEFVQFLSEKNNPNSIQDNYVTGLAFDPPGTLWVATTGGLCSYDAQSNSFTRYSLTNVNPNDTYRYRVIRSLQLSGNKIYLGTYGGLQVFDRTTHTSKHFIHRAGDKSSISHNSVFSVVQNPEGKFWIATYGGGLNLFDPLTETFAHWKRDGFNPVSISSDNLFSAYIDRSGLLWIGAADNTLCLYNPQAKKFNSLPHRIDQPDGISKGWIRAVFQENDSIFWLGFNGQGLERLNLETGLTQKFRHDPANANSLGHNSIIAIDKDASGKIWIALEGGGLNRLNPVTGEITRFTQGGSNSINNNAISAMLVDSENKIWATAYRSGLNIYDIDHHVFKRINNDSLVKQTGISLAYVEAIYELDGNIWFNAQNQVAVYDKKRNRFTRIAEAGKLVQVDNPAFLEIRPYSETQMMLITRDEAIAIRYISPDSIERVSMFKTNKAGLRSFVVSSNYIWYITYNNVARLNPKTNETRLYTQADGILLPGEFKFALKDRQGRIFITSTEGLSWFYPGQIEDDTVSRNFAFTNLRLFNHTVTQEQDSVHRYAIPGQLSELKSITLNHNHSFFSVEYAAFEFMAPEKIQYAYKLDGFDEDWVDVGNRTFASYTNLDPGNYTFRVKYTNPDGFRSPHVASLHIRINPPYWRTWWFISFVVLALASILYALHRYRLAQSLQLERLRTKIASDLHDEVGSSLTRISIYSELVQNGLSDKEKANYLSAIGGLSREVVSTMSDMVWSIDNGNDTLEALIIRMKDFATEVLNAKNIAFSFTTNDHEGRKIIEPAVRQNIYLIFKEAINNIVKHAGATHVSVSLIYHNQLELKIADNGIGLPQSQQRTGNGLRNMQRRAKTIQANLTLSSGSGTSVHLVVSTV